MNWHGFEIHRELNFQARPDMIDANIYETLIGAILVFSRARTSAV
jgi:hypothetical protein